MRSTIILFILSVSILLQSCDFEPVVSRSMGGEDELVVILDPLHIPERTGDSVTNSQLYDSIRFHLNKFFPVVYPPESQFDLTFINIEANSIIEKSRSQLVICALSEETKIARYVKSQVSQDVIDQVMNSPNGYFAIASNVHAEPQRIGYLLAATTPILYEALRNQGPRIREYFSEFEFNYLKGSVLREGRKNSIEDSLRNRIGCSIPVPTKYDVVEPFPDDKYKKYDNEFYWIRSDVNNIVRSITFFVQPFSGLDSTISRDSLARYMHDEMGKRYVDSELPGDILRISHQAPLAIDTTTINGMPVLITRGMWEFVNDFKGGSFVNYMFKDEMNNRWISVNGMVYSPFHSGRSQTANLKKRKFLRAMEAVIAQLVVTPGHS